MPETGVEPVRSKRSQDFKSCASANSATPAAMEGEGFEPSKAEPTDLQSAPFGHSGIPPESQQKIYYHICGALSIKKFFQNG